jgi:hypothetical protein
MYKSVELSATVFRWIQRHSFISEEVIIGIVLNTPKSARKYIDENHFEIEFFRNNKRHTLKIALWVYERATTFFVYKAHSKKD